MNEKVGALGRPGLLKFCSPNEYALSNLRSSVSNCQRYALFNDPFEFRTHLRSGIPDEKTKRDRLSAETREWVGLCRSSNGTISESVLNSRDRPLEWLTYSAHNMTEAARQTFNEQPVVAGTRNIADPIKLTQLCP